MRILLFFCILLLGACHVSEIKKITPPEDSKTQVIKLEGNLGVVSLSLPARYDTIFTWIHYSDCGAPCEKRKYRLQPKTLPVYMETGFHYKPLNDSVEQFTIVHNPYIPAADSDKTNNKDFIISFHDHKKFYIIHDPALRTIKSDTIEKIGDRYFSIIVIDKYDTANAAYSKKLLSTTTIKRGTIDFNFELLSKKKDSLTENFIDEAKYYLRTIRIEKSDK
jgi:hypothetical protein